jgi:hypothetical protein
MGIAARSRADKRSAGTIASPIVSNVLITAGIVATLALGFVGAARAQVPSVDIRQTCRAAASAMVLMQGSRTSEKDFEQCMSAEQAARDQIAKDWATFSATDKERCLQTKVYLPSYIEWQTCIEMERDARKMRGDNPSPGLGLSGVYTLPTVTLGINDARPERGPVTWVTMPTVQIGINDARSERGPRTWVTMPIVRPGVLY